MHIPRRTQKRLIIETLLVTASKTTLNLYLPRARHLDNKYIFCKLVW